MKKNLFITMAVMLSVTACEPQDKEQQQQQQQQKFEAVAAGENLFIQYCSACHVRKGRGNYLKNIPVDLLARRSEAELMTWIRGSDKHREMPNFTQLSDEKRQQLSMYLLSQTGN